MTEQGQEPTASGPEPQEEEAQTGQEPEERYDAEYVRRLRAEAADYRRRLRDLEATVKQHEEEKLSEAERLQKRLAELEREREEWQRERRERTLQYEVAVAAQRLGIIDPDAAYRLLDVSRIEFDEERGSPTNVEQALKDLLKAKPYLAGTAVPTAGSPTNPATGQQRGGTFTASQIADRRFYEAHRDEILAAMAEGRIVPG